MKKYSVELTWDIDQGDKDRPDTIVAALQKQEGKFSWRSIQVIDLNQGNNWSGEFEPVPVGVMDGDGPDAVMEKCEYRVREVRPVERNVAPPQTDQEKLDSADKRTIYDKYDFDKPLISNLIKAFDPRNNISADATLAYLKQQGKKVLIPDPTFVTHIDQYIDKFGFNVEEHDTKYHVKYDHNSKTHKMKITNTAVIDASIYKHWIKFKDDDKTSRAEVCLDFHTYLILDFDPLIGHPLEKFFLREP